jgi:hypothetical protein
MNGWLFPMGKGFFTQTRWWLVHVCSYKNPNKTDCPTKSFQSRLSTLMNKERRQ